MGSNTEDKPHLPWVKTPCIESRTLSNIAGCQIFLKLENIQPSGSFKSRGLGYLMMREIEKHGSSKPIHFYCSSGGNAGLACAIAAISLKKNATIVVPLTTKAFVIQKLKRLGADVHQHGAAWVEADKYLREELLANDENGVYVPPFDHPDVWHGASKLVGELDEQIGDYDGIVCSIGGGGLFNGIMEGLSKREVFSEKPVRVLAMETYGADSLNSSLRQRRHVTLPSITSIATSLGCSRVSNRTWELAHREQVSSLAVADAEAAIACVRLADDERILVEAACGVNVAPVYNGMLRSQLGKGMLDDEWAKQKIIIIICGGSNVTLKMLEGYREKYMQSVEKRSPIQSSVL
ncbi:MAG: hypothetical protein M1818_003877 [Claussenomyces sp. TS43310]|nr:MAG: hypothetical protein M1818_003877 [Claussenomyces sp. TS43310]